MTLDYSAVLADLQDRRAQLDAAISAIAPLAERRRQDKSDAPSKPAKEPKREAKRTPRCKLCRLEGHNSKTCPTTKPNGKIAELYRRCGDCSQKTPAKGACNHCGAKEAA